VTETTNVCGSKIQTSTNLSAQVVISSATFLLNNVSPMHVQRGLQAGHQAEEPEMASLVVLLVASKSKLSILSNVPRISRSLQKLERTSHVKRALVLVRSEVRLVDVSLAPKLLPCFASVANAR